MTYNAVLDTLFYSLWVGLCFLGVYLVIVYIVKRIFFPKVSSGWFTGIAYFVVPFLWIMILGTVNPFAWGYGKPVEITHLTCRDGTLFVQDYIMSSGSKATRGSPSFRMHLIDPLTGKKKRRFVLGGNGTLTGVRGDTLVFCFTNAVVFFSAATGKEIREWTAKTLPGLFPQLASGVHGFQVDRERNQIDLTSLDGNKWTLNVKTGTLAPVGTDLSSENHLVNGIKLDKYGISVDSGKHRSRIAALCDKEGAEHQKILCSHNDEIFLDGKIVGFSMREGCFIIMHYETIARLKMIFTCMSLDGKQKMWELRQSKLRPSEKNSEKSASSFCVDEADGICFLSIENEIMAVRLKDGAILWRQIP